MKWDGKFPITDRWAARVVAQAYVKCGCNMTRAVEEELRVSDFASHGSARNFASKLLLEPAVAYEINVLLNRVGGQDSNAFLQRMWEWLNHEADGTKETEENRRTAARILAKGYIREKGPEKADSKPVIFSGLEDGIGNLTGETPVVEEKDPKKVM